MYVVFSMLVVLPSLVDLALCLSIISAIVGECKADAGQTPFGTLVG